MRTKFRSEDLKETDHSEEPGICERIMLEWIGKYCGKVWIGCI
jgi:hypothetical protein